MPQTRQAARSQLSGVSFHKAPIAVVLGLIALAGCRQDPVAAARAFIASGDRYAAAEQFEAAALEYRNALSHQPDWAEPHHKLARAYDKLRQPDKALEALVRVTELDESYTDANLRVASASVTGERYEDAERLARRVLARQPEHAEALSISASALDGMGQATAARRQIDRALKADPRSSAALVALASWHVRRGDVTPAAETLRRAVDFHPQAVEAWTALANVEWRLGESARAETALHRVLTLSRDKSAARRLLASLYLQTNRAEQAEPHMRALAETGSGDRLALADYYLALNKRESATPLLQELAKDRDEDIAAQAHLRRAVLAISAGAMDEAHAAIDLAMKQRSAEPQALVLKSELLADEGNLDAALECAQKAAALRPEWGDANYALAMAHLARGEAADAERELKRARDRVRAPALVDLELARLALSRRDVNTAVTLARQAVGSEPSAAAYAVLSQALRAAGDMTEARRVLALARSESPDSVELETELGYLELSARRPDRARAAFERALRALPSSTAGRSGLVLSYAAEGGLAAARTSLNAWRAEMPRDAQLAILSAQIDLAEGNPRQAQNTLAEASGHAPRNAELAETLAQVHLANGDREGALRQYEKVAELRPNSAAAITAVGMLKQEAGDRAGAAAAYERALAIAPEAGVAANNLAWLYAESGKLDDASRIAERAVRSLGRSPESLDTLGWVTHLRGESEAAVMLLSQAVAKAPNNALYRHHLARAREGARKRTGISEVSNLSKDE